MKSGPSFPQALFKKEEYIEDTCVNVLAGGRCVLNLTGTVLKEVCGADQSSKIGNSLTADHDALCAEISLFGPSPTAVRVKCNQAPFLLFSPTQGELTAWTLPLLWIPLAMSGTIFTSQTLDNEHPNITYFSNGATPLADAWKFDSQWDIFC